MEPVVDHFERLRAFVPSQFRGVVIDSLIASIASEMQDIDEDHFDLWLSSQLSVAAGPLLDQWGKLVGEKRSGLDDDDFRVFIEARILVNLTDGNGVDVQTIAELLTAPSSVRIFSYSTWGYEVSIQRASFMKPRRAARVGRFLRMCKPGGVPIDIVEERPGDFGFLGYGSGYGVGTYARAL